MVDENGEDFNNQNDEVRESTADVGPESTYVGPRIDGQLFDTAVEDLNISSDLKLSNSDEEWEDAVDDHHDTRREQVKLRRDGGCSRRSFLRKLKTYLCLPLKHPCVSFPTCRWFRLILVSALVTFTFIVLIMWFGKLYEHAQVRRGIDTTEYYQTLQVCALINQTNDDASPNSNSTATASKYELVLTTLSSVDEAYYGFDNASFSVDGGNATMMVRQHRKNKTIVAHCGECGSCSNPHDVNIYDQTKNTLYSDSIACAKHGILGGRKAVEQCMLNSVNMTSACNTCWVDNILCDLRKCIFTCFLHAIFNKGVKNAKDQNSQPEGLNPCTMCDEIRCGPQFIACAGANRRRTGILSDIERNTKTEVCHKVDPKKWWKNARLQGEWELQQQQLQMHHSDVDANSTSESNRMLLRRQS